MAMTVGADSNEPWFLLTWVLSSALMSDFLPMPLRCMLSQGIRVWVNCPTLKKQSGESKRHRWACIDVFQQSLSRRILMNMPLTLQGL